MPVHAFIDEPRITNHEEPAVLERNILTLTEIWPHVVRGVTPTLSVARRPRLPFASGSANNHSKGLNGHTAL